MFTPAEAYAFIKELTLERMKMHRVNWTTYGCDNLTGTNQDTRWPPVKSRITEKGIVSEDARRQESCNIPRYNGSYQNYPQVHLGNLIQQCELMLRRGDTSCYDNVDNRDVPSYTYVGPDGVSKTTHLYPGRGSVERAINAIIIDSGTEWRRGGALWVAYRYYLQNKRLAATDLSQWAPHLASGAKCWQDICFGTLTHGFAPEENPLLPTPVPTPPRPNAFVNGASFRSTSEPGSGVAPGEILTILGDSLAAQTQWASALPLPTTLGDTSVIFNGIPAPLFFVSSAQINTQVPFELVTGAGTVTVEVERGSQTSGAQLVTITTVSPGIFTLNQQGTGAGAIFHGEDFQPVSESAPARHRELLVIFCTGLGPVQPEVQSGHIAPSTEPLARTLSTPLVNIGGMPAEVTFSGLTPGYVGLYQVNVQLPAGVPSGTQSVEIIINGVPSNTVTIAVQ